MSGKQQSSTGDNSVTKQTKNNNHKSKKIIKKSLKFTKPQKTAKISANVNNNNTHNNNNIDTTCNNNNNEKDEENFVVNDEIIEEFDFSDSDLAELNASSILSSSDGDTMLAIVEGEEAKEETVGLVQWSVQQELEAEHTTVIDNDGKQVEETETEVEMAENSADNNDKHELSSTTIQETATTIKNNEEEQSLLLPSTKCTTTETEFHGENLNSTEDVAASTFTSSSNQTNGNNFMAEALPNGKTNTMLDLKSKQINDSSSIVIPAAAAVANDGNSCHNDDGDENDDNGSEYIDEPYDELLVQFLDEANNIVSKSIVVITYIQLLYIHIHIWSPYNFIIGTSVKF